MTRTDRVLDAYRKAYNEIEAVYPEHITPGTLHAHIRQQFPGMADKIDTAEKQADASAVAYIEVKSGGVQEKITAWRDVWMEAIQMLTEAR